MSEEEKTWYRQGDLSDPQKLMSLMPATEPPSRNIGDLSIDESPIVAIIAQLDADWYRSQKAWAGFMDGSGQAPGVEGPVFALDPSPVGANGPSGPGEPFEARVDYGMASLDRLLALAREIWGLERLTLEQIAVRAGVDHGKLCRLARGASKDTASRAELEVTFGNIIFSMIRWADDIGLSPGACVARAFVAQRDFVAQNSKR